MLVYYSIDQHHPSLGLHLCFALSILSLLLPSIEAELRFFGGAFYFDSQKRPTSILRKEGIDGLPSPHWIKVKNSRYSQLEGREELFDRSLGSSS